MGARAWRGRAASATLLVGLLLSLGRSAFAQSPPTVDVTLVAGGDDADPLMDTIRELVGRLGLSVNPHRVDVSDARLDAGARPPGLSVWVDLASRYEVVTIVRNGRTEVRRTISRDASPAIVREEIGEAVRSAVESQLLAAEQPSAPPAVSNAPAPASAPSIMESPTAPAPAASSHGLALDVTTVAGAGPIATGSGLVAHLGGGLVAATRRGWRPSVSMTAEYLVPFDTPLSSVPVTARASLVSLRTLAAVEVLHRSWIAVDLGAGGGVDVISVVPGATDASQTITVNPQVPRVDPVLTARAIAYVGLTPGVAFTLIAGSDFDLASIHYVVNGAQGGDILVPWRVRPVVLAGFTFTALGSGLFAARTP